MRKSVLITIMLAVCLFTACSRTEETDQLTRVASQVEQALPGDAIKQYQIEVYHLFSAADTEGNHIEYYLCVTTYLAAGPEAVPNLHTDAFASVFDLESTQLIRELDICGYASAIYQGPEQNYLCCTFSPTTSVVLEYDPDSLSEDDAIKVIRSIYEPVAP